MISLSNMISINKTNLRIWRRWMMRNRLTSVVRYALKMWLSFLWSVNLARSLTVSLAVFSGNSKISEIIAPSVEWTLGSRWDWVYMREINTQSFSPYRSLALQASALQHVAGQVWNLSRTLKITSNTALTFNLPVLAAHLLHQRLFSSQIFIFVINRWKKLAQGQSRLQSMFITYFTGRKPNS
jgi:hypothetical protein